MCFWIKAAGKDVANRADLADSLESPEHQETMLLGFRYNPTPALSAGVVIHGAASILENPLNEIYYENKSISRSVEARRAPDSHRY